MFHSDQDTSKTSLTPGSGAEPLDQGNSNTCTCHAIANAIADQFEEKDIEIDPSCLATLLVNNNKSIGAVWPDFYDNYDLPITIMNQRTGEWISVKIKSVTEVKKFSCTDKHVLAYYANKIKQADGTWIWVDYHCAFIQRQSGDLYDCVNSWKNDPHPKVELNRSGNRLWKVIAEANSPRAGSYFVNYQSSSSCRIYLSSVFKIIKS